jgi:hypothetical protein
MRFPDFLVIGAMKAGTTSLCRDLEAQSEIFFPSVKEPHTLVLEEVLTNQGRQNYAALFDQAKAGQVCGEGSTGYSKRSLHEGIPDRAHTLLGSGLKIIYIVREPVARTLSHHYHMYRGDDAPRDVERAIKNIPQLIDVSRYARQLEPWIDVFGRAQIRIVQFEEYIENRKRTVAEICAFLGVEYESNSVSAETAHNIGEKQLLPPGFLQGITRKVTRSQWYKRVVHPRVPQWVRDRIKAVFYEEAKERPAPPSIELVDHIIEELRSDMDRLQTIMGRDEPLWDMEAVRQRFLMRENA